MKKNSKGKHKAIYQGITLGLRTKNLETTDWNVFYESCDDLSELAKVTSSYVDFLSDVCIQFK